MHPTIMMALAHEGERELQKLQVRSQVHDRGPGSNGARAARRLARRLIAGVSLRPRLS
jgi:hypothetical protein